ncbi:S-M checkpoint control protein CID1 and related nucleotidyltransferases [Ceraceosorus bombacis]|uniref:S-M checkpoint control protein CID1 and related nucleotidyltransferases n=1 Tax=Ceraceosorus bombacis TaxID=401625 RepID=A0A0P1BF58_9BASI|nr:S-M checkpoint control protein CID1 and related nucleotidyltransferases [Ceraceosorus bombacis]
MASDDAVPTGPRQRTSRRAAPNGSAGPQPRASSSSSSTSPTSSSTSLFPVGDISPIQTGPDGIHRDVAAPPFRVRATGPRGAAPSGPSSGSAPNRTTQQGQSSSLPAQNGPRGHIGVRIASFDGPAQQPQLLAKSSLARAADVPLTAPKGPRRPEPLPGRPSPAARGSSPETRKMYASREVALVRRALQKVDEMGRIEKQHLASCQESGVRGVGEAILTLWQTSRPDDRWQRKREGLLCRVQKAIDKGWPDQGLIVTPFGSSVTGLEGAESDMDLVLLDQTRPLGAATPLHLTLPSPRPVRLVRGMPDFYDVYTVSKALRRQGFESVVPVAYAAVPIVKFKDSRTGLDLDLNINDRFGLQNSALIKAYAELRPQLLRPLIFAVKHWAKRRFLNDPAGNFGQPSMSSYALSLLVIQYLQSTGDLPNLQSPQLLRALNMPKERMWKPPRPQAPNVMAKILQARERDRKQGKHVAELVGAKSYETTFTFLRDPHECAKYRQEPQSLAEQLEALGTAFAGFFAWLRGSSGLFKTSAASIVAGGFIPRTPYMTEAERKLAKKKNREARSQADPQHRQKESTALIRTTDGQQTSNDIEMEASDTTAISEEPDDSTVSVDESIELSEPPRDSDHGGEKSDPAAGRAFDESAPRHWDDSDTTDVISLERYDEPESWANNPIVVQDPFIVDRNCSGAIREVTAQRFEDEVERATGMLARALQARRGAQSSAALVLADLCEDVRIADAGYYVHDVEERTVGMTISRSPTTFIRPEMPESFGRNGSRILALLDKPERDELDQLLQTQALEDELERNTRQTRAMVERREFMAGREGKRQHRGGARDRAKRDTNQHSSKSHDKLLGTTRAQ